MKRKQESNGHAPLIVIRYRIVLYYCDNVNMSDNSTVVSTIGVTEVHKKHTYHIYITQELSTVTSWLARWRKKIWTIGEIYFETYNSLSNIFLSIYVNNSFVLKIYFQMEQHQYTPEWGQAQISIENRDPNLFTQIFRQDWLLFIQID